MKGGCLKNIKQPVITAAAIASIVGVSTMGVSLAANAQANDGNNLVDKIAKKFHLNKDDVQKVFDDNRAEHEADRQQRLENRLDKSVSDGKITSAQKGQIMAKLEEMKSFFDSLKDKSPSERKTALKDKRAELQKWAKDNKIPKGLLMPAGLHHGFGGHRPEPGDND
jgi:hypothetical protein